MLSVDLKLSHYSDKNLTHHRTELEVFVTNTLEKINVHKNVLNTDRLYSKVRNWYWNAGGIVWDNLKWNYNPFGVKGG